MNKFELKYSLFYQKNMHKYIYFYFGAEAGSTNCVGFFLSSKLTEGQKVSRQKLINRSNVTKSIKIIRAHQ